MCALEVTFEVMPEFHAALGPTPGIDPHFMHGNMDAMMELVGAPFTSSELQPIEPGSQRVVYVLRRKASPPNPPSGSKSALLAPHSGQYQESGICSKGVPGAMPESGSPSAGS